MSKGSLVAAAGGLVMAAGLVLILAGLATLALGPPTGWVGIAHDFARGAEYVPVVGGEKPGGEMAPVGEADPGESKSFAATPAPASVPLAPELLAGGPEQTAPVSPTASVPETVAAVPTGPATDAPGARTPFLPITRILIPRIRLEADVSSAELVERDGGMTWEVPAFRAGHAEATAGAGDPGNAVLLGHLASRGAGDVFRDLNTARVGDLVRVSSGEDTFEYRVVAVRTVPRTDVSILGPTRTATLSLVTCAGTWLPLIRDYTQRLVVHAELVGPGRAPTTPTGPTMSSAVFEERFLDNRHAWPSDRQSTAWFGDGGYRLSAREPGRFVAVGAPIDRPLADVVVTGRFRKVGGPPGGGYGLIVRDQGTRARDGIDQGGRYYVLEVGDRGEVGIWRREEDHWVDLLPWTPSDAVLPGGAANELTVRAIGARLTFLVNGVQVAAAEDSALAAGGVGAFLGGDANEGLLEWLVVQTP